MYHTAILLVACPDQRGLVASIADFVYRHGGNIVHADEHGDLECDRFLMRVEFDPSEFDIELSRFAEFFSPIAEKFDMHWRLAESSNRPKMIILVSKYDHMFWPICCIVTRAES
jgi:formyltetrahydrofolate deformylase